MDNLMVRYSQCCQPVPGDDVIGYITRGRGVSIHRTDCPNILNLADRPERRVDIEWDTDETQRFLVRLVLEGTDRHGLFADIARMQGQFVVEVENLSHLKKVMKQVRRVKGVIAIERRESFGESDLTIETL
jgi:GTP pyrophosphokinase